MSQESTSYVPGVCNINTKEIAQRRKAGYFGLALAVILVAAIFALNLNRYFRVVLFVPVFISAIGFLQAKNKFCVGYGSAGMHNADEGSENAQSITDNDAVIKDKKRSKVMYLQATLIAVLVTMLVALI